MGAGARRWLLFGAALAVGCGPPSREDRFTAISQGLNVCPTTVVEGMDVYDGQGTIDWQAAATDGGRRFAFIKATQGDYNTQPTFGAYWAGALDAGVLRSPYHFFDPTVDGITQAQKFLDELNANGGLQPGDLPPLLDLECPTSSTQSSADPNCEYTGGSGWVATSTLSQRVFDWLNTVGQATGRATIIYSYPSWFQDVGFTDARLAQYPLFIATIGSCASVPAPWTSTVFWQYDWNGTVAGINGPVDLDRFLGTDEQLIGFANGSGPDAGMPDAGEADAGTIDAGSPDAGGVTSADAGPRIDAGSGTDAGASSGNPRAGCGCGASGSGSVGWVLGLLIAVLFRTVALARRAHVTSFRGEDRPWTHTPRRSDASRRG